MSQEEVQEPSTPRRTQADRAADAVMRCGVDQMERIAGEIKKRSETAWMILCESFKKSEGRQ